ncbi:NF038105 family protein [Acinetobacter sp. TSRC1-2]|uniref:NF038105 family protein n=1 Tax=unclassified Acinetobacter TaxID=196816 RepID=UPI003CEB9739
MTTQKFDATPTPNEAMNLDGISEEKVKEAWKAYEAKPEYKKFNKHDLIESMQSSNDEAENSEKV